MMRRDELTENLRENNFFAASDHVALLVPKTLTFRRFNHVVLAAVSVALSLTTSTAADWYVRPGGAGSKTGSDWNNAWDSGGISWSGISVGDTIWMAGGSYANAIHPTKNGISGNPIYVKRVQSTDSIPVASSGWNNSFDSQVVINNQSGINWSSSGNFVIVDGRVSGGIKVNMPNNSNNSSAVDVVSAHDIVLTNIEMAGPGGNTSFSSDLATFGMNGAYNVVITHCLLHGAPNMINTLPSHDIIFDHCKFYDNNAANASAIHPNVAYLMGCANITFRYCDFSNWAVEGIYLLGNCSNIYLYGNTWHDGWSGQPYRVLSLDQYGNSSGSQGPVYVYNNTFYGIQGVGIYDKAGNSEPYATGSQARNNIYWNCSLGNQVPADTDYEYGNSGASGSHSATISSSPFVSPTNYHLTANTPAGQTLSSPYNIDADGKTRTTWTRGAYEYGSQSIQEPVISNVKCSAGTNTATITWTTDKNANSIVNYGLAVSYGISVTNSSLVTSHNVTLANLAAGTYYNFQVQSIDSTNSLNSSGNQMFNTINPAMVEGLHVVQP